MLADPVPDAPVIHSLPTALNSGSAHCAVASSSRCTWYSLDGTSRPSRYTASTVGKISTEPLAVLLEMVSLTVITVFGAE